ATTGADRATWLEAYVRARVNAVSGGTVDASGTAALKELGLDSLMLVRLRNDFARDLGVEIPAAEVFAATDTRGLARMLAEALPQRAAPTTAAPGEPDRGRPDVPDSELLPATRDVVRLLPSARPGMPAAPTVPAATRRPRRGTSSACCAAPGRTCRPPPTASASRPASPPPSPARTSPPSSPASPPATRPCAPPSSPAPTAPGCGWTAHRRGRCCAGPPSPAPTTPAPASG